MKNRWAQRQDRSFKTVLLQNSSSSGSGSSNSAAGAERRSSQQVLYIIHYHTTLLSPDYSKADHMVYNVYALDVDKCHPEDRFPHPILTLPVSETEFPFRMGVGRLGSSIYFIGGMVYEKPSLKVFIFDTERVKSEKLPIANPRDFIKDGPNLKGGKFFDPIVVTVGEKLYAIARSFNPDTRELDGPRVEVLDPELGAWEALPEPVYEPSYGLLCNYRVGGYDVVGSRILLWTERKRWFELDTDFPDKGWVPRWSDKGIRSYNGGSEVVDGIVFPCYPFPPFPPNRGESGVYMVSYDTAMLESSADVNLCFTHPSPGEEESPITFEGSRRLLSYGSGSGRAVVFSSGHNKRFDDGGPFFYTFEVIRLEKRANAGARSGGAPFTFVLEKLLSYHVGVSKNRNYICGCFLI